MKSLLTITAAVLISSLAIGQDAVTTDTLTLKNGNQITGTVKSTTGDKLLFESPVLGSLEIPISDITNLQTAGKVELLTKDGDRLQRRITGLKDGSLMVDGADALSMDNLDMLNPPAEVEPKWTGSLNIGASYSDGNTSRRSAHTAAKAQRRGKEDRITADASWDYSEDKASGTWVLTQRRTSGGLKYDYFLSKKSYVYGTARATGDTLADLELRFIAGAGYGYQWVEEEDLRFATEVGLSYFNENYRSMTPSTDTIAARAAYALYYEINEDVKFLQDVEAYPGLESSDDIYVTKDSRLQMSLTDDMFAQLQWILEYDNTPSPGLDRVDHRFNLSVGWTF